MIDLHTHVLYGIDDGSQDIENSIEMLRVAERVGFRGVVLTPHYMCYTPYVSRADENRKRMRELTKRLKVEGIGITLYLGNELYFEPNAIEMIDTGAFTTLNRSDYFLVETMRHDTNRAHIQTFIYQLQIKGYQTILAHPERYDFIQKDPNVVIDCLEKGVLMQVNALSLIGFYGSRSKETAEILLEHQMAQFLASDAHKIKSYELMPQALEKAESLIGKEQLKELTWHNPSVILSGKGNIRVSPKEYHAKPKKKRIFPSWRTGKHIKRKRS